VDSVEIGNVVLHQQRFHVVPLPYVAVHGYPEELMGAMGYELLRRLAVSIDFDRKQFRLYDRPTFQYTGSGFGLPFLGNGAGAGHYDWSDGEAGAHADRLCGGQVHSVIT
jgi:hypothetical protein